MNLTNGVFDNFEFPGENTAQILKAMNLEAKNLDSSGPGQAAQFLAHDKGISYRFFMHPEYSKEMSKKLKYEHFNNLVMLEWFVRKDFKPAVRIDHLPEELLTFEKELIEVPTSDGKGTKEIVKLGDVIGGLYFDAYKKWKEGVQTPGLPLNKWGVFDEGECASLNAMGVFSVEQLAAMPRSKFSNPQMPASFLEGFERAIQYVNGKINRSGEEALAKQIIEVEKENRSKDAAIKELQAQMKVLMSAKPAKGKPGRPKKVKVVEGVIEDVEE